MHTKSGNYANGTSEDLTFWAIISAEEGGKLLRTVICDASRVVRHVDGAMSVVGALECILQGGRTKFFPKDVYRRCSSTIC